MIFLSTFPLAFFDQKVLAATLDLLKQIGLEEKIAVGSLAGNCQVWRVSHFVDSRPVKIRELGIIENRFLFDPTNSVRVQGAVTITSWRDLKDIIRSSK